MKLKPLADRVLLKQEKAETKTASGIIIPETAQEKTQTASVEAVGPGTEKDPITVKVGDRVMYDKYAGVQVKMDGEDYLIVKKLRGFFLRKIIRLPPFRSHILVRIFLQI